MAQFSILFGHTGNSVAYGGGYIVDRDDSKVDLHEGDELEPSKMQSMYDRAYGDIVLGQVKGLTPFYRLLNTLFRLLSLQEGATWTTYPIGPRTCLLRWLPGDASLQSWNSFGMKSLLVHQIPLVHVTMLLTSSI